MEPAPEGGHVVASPPYGAGKRGRPASRMRSNYDWDIIADWLRARPGTWARYGPVLATQVQDVRNAYPDLVVLGFKYHHVTDTTPVKALVKWCDVFVAFEPEERP